MNSPIRADVLRNEWIVYKAYAEDAHLRYSTKTNDLIRQLALAGIAVVWIFRETVTGKTVFPPELRWGATFLLLTLAVDLAHYFFTALSIGSRLDDLEHQENEALRKGKKWPDKPSGLPPRLPEAFAKVAFFAKTVTLVLGSGLLLFFLAFKF